MNLLVRILTCIRRPVEDILTSGIIGLKNMYFQSFNSHWEVKAYGLSCEMHYTLGTGKKERCLDTNELRLHTECYLILFLFIK